MEKVKWKDSYSVGIKEIDTQHKNLFELLNKLIENRGESVRSKIITDTLTEMTNYAKYHFEAEEKYMEKCGFPNLVAHKMEHRGFIKKTGSLNFNAMERNETVPEDILKFLEHWLISHILEGDMELKKCPNNK